MRIGILGVDRNFLEIASSILCRRNQIYMLSTEEFKTAINLEKELKSNNIDYCVAELNNSIYGENKNASIILNNPNIVKIDEEKLKINYSIFKIREEITFLLDTIICKEEILEQTKDTIKLYFGWCNTSIITNENREIKKLISGKISGHTAIICENSLGITNKLDMIYDDMIDNKDNYTTYGLFRYGG